MSGSGGGKPLHIATIIGLSLLLWGGEYLVRDLWEPDEARYVYVAREMCEDGHWLVPHRNGEFYAHKPPLMFWLQNAFSVFTGGTVNKISGRLPSLLGAILSLWAISRIALLWGHTAASRRVVPILLTTFMFWQVSGMGQIDALLCGLQMMALYLLFRADADEAAGEAPHRRRNGIRSVAYLFMGLAVLAKGPVGCVIPIGAYATAQLVSGNRRQVLKPHLLWGVVLAALPCALWLFAAWKSNPPDGYLSELLFDQNAGRVTGTKIHGHHRPFYYFLWHFPLEFLPWTAFLVPGVVLLRRRPELRETERRLFGWVLFVIAAFSLSVTKRNLYILLAYPAAALLTALAWDEIVNAGRRLKLTLGVAFCSLFAVVAIGMVVLQFIPGIPIDTAALWPSFVGSLAGAVVLIAMWQRQGMTEKWLYTLCAFLFVNQAVAATFIYGAINPLKAPYAMTMAAEKYLPDGQELLIYRMNGEIQALYAGARGKRSNMRAEIFADMKRQRRGLIAVEAKQWKSISDHGSLRGGEYRYRMGHKEMIYVPFDMDAPNLPPVP